MGDWRPISGADCDVFLSWANAQGFRIGPENANKDVQDAFQGFTAGDLRWLCKAMIQAQPKKPDLATLRRAVLARNVAILRLPNDRTPKVTGTG